MIEDDANDPEETSSVLDSIPRPRQELWFTGRQLGGFGLEDPSGI